MRKAGDISKIIYFDKETINNILQELNKGDKQTQIGTNTTIKGTGDIEVEAKVKLGVPFLERLSFLFSGKVSLSYIRQKDSKTTITSTEISEFEKLKAFLTARENIQIKDIENSSTFFRVAGGYLRMVKGGVDEVDVKEFKNVMDSYDGYDTYKISNTEYVRFNNSAFVSNYKRNDLLTTKMDLYCVSIGVFDKKDFDFLEQINKMETLITGVGKTKNLSDLYPSDDKSVEENGISNETLLETKNHNNNEIKLYDVIYAAIPLETPHVGGSHE